jgi:hypothetical protein
MGLGTLLGVAALVATVGLSGTANHHIVRRFDELAATTVIARPREPLLGSEVVPNRLPWRPEARLSRVDGVVVSGTLTRIDLVGRTVRALRDSQLSRGGEASLELVAASEGLPEAVGAVVRTGRSFDAGHDARAAPVALLGRAAADVLGIREVYQSPAVFIGELPLTVIGILGDTPRAPALTDAIVVTNGWARQHLGLTAPDEVRVLTEIGAAQVVSDQVPLALSATGAEDIAVTKPADPLTTRAKIAGDLQGLLLLSGGIALVLGGLGIANATLVGVMERTGEIGLRRSLGAPRHHVALQFLLEAGMLGLVAGSVGASVGILIVVAVSAMNGWTPIIDGWLPVAAATIGAAIGLLAGAYPSWKAAGVHPIEALRRTA